MGSVAVKMLLHNRARFLSTVAGIAVAFFLSAAQIGLLVGWCNTTTAIVRHSGADLWVAAKQTSAFDYGYAIPKNRIYQVRSIHGVEWAEGMLMTWVFWQRPDGRRITVELVGLDESLAGGPWNMRQGSVESVREPDGVIVDAAYCDALGVQNLGDEAELLGNRAVLKGVCQDVRTFTAAPFVFTSLHSAVKYDPYYKDDEITYVLVRCAAGESPEKVRDAIAANVPAVEVLTTDELAMRTVKYWMLETGIGITVVITAVLGLLVGAVIISQTLYAITQDHRGDYATLLAIGFGRRQLVLVVLVQALALGALGIGLGQALLSCAARFSLNSPVPIETTTLVSAGTMLISLLCCILASTLSLRSIARIDPVVVFRA